MWEVTPAIPILLQSYLNITCGSLKFGHARVRGIHPECAKTTSSDRVPRSPQASDLSMAFARVTLGSVRPCKTRRFVRRRFQLDVLAHHLLEVSRWLVHELFSEEEPAARHAAAHKAPVVAPVEKPHLGLLVWNDASESPNGSGPPKGENEGNSKGKKATR